MLKAHSESNCPTQRAPDWWESARFQAVAWLGVDSVKIASPHPAHQRVTPAVSWLRSTHIAFSKVICDRNRHAII